MSSTQSTPLENVNSAVAGEMSARQTGVPEEGVPPHVLEERQRAIEKNPEWVALGERWRVHGDATPEEIQAAPFDPEYVLASDGRVKHRIEVQYAVRQEMYKQHGVPEDWRRDEYKIAWHKEQLARLEKADAAPRCGWVREDGTTCGSPRVTSGKYCYAHARMEQVKPRRMRLAPMEDANSIMMNLMAVQQALIDGAITEKAAGMLFYSIQIAACVQPNLTFGESPREMVRVAPKPTRHRRGAEARRNEVAAGERTSGRNRERVSGESMKRLPKLRKLKGEGGPPERALRSTGAGGDPWG